jgi:hypothetical protein
MRLSTPNNEGFPGSSRVAMFASIEAFSMEVDMIRSRAYCAAVFALPLLIVSTVADAQQRARKDQMSDEAIAARTECFREAQARFPGPTGGNVSINSQRETAYRTCAQRKGIRP